jgi:hypothetical protein
MSSVSRFIHSYSETARYSVKKFAIIVASLLLGSCQVVTKLNRLEVSESKADAVQDGMDGLNATDAEVREDAAALCPIADGAQCNLVRQCGCKPGEHCQARGSDLRSSCFKPGDHAPWSACRDASECPAGQTCDRGSCRSYCGDDSDCEAGSCLPTAGPNAKPNRDVRVCWRNCEPNSIGACANGTACRSTKTPYAKTGTFCVAPYDPCPTLEDGTCDERKGTGSCADGADTKDCQCAPQLSQAVCDPVAQCGCAAGLTCNARVVGVPVSGGAAPTYTAQCDQAGTHKLYAACTRSGECLPGLTCDETLGMCVNQCAVDRDCTEGVCRKLPNQARVALGLCTPICKRATNKPCLANTVCASFDARYDLGFSKPGDYCWRPLHEDCPINNSCDEPQGTALCAAGADEKDCCKPPSPDGECDPVSQCGCASKPGTQCRHMSFSTTTSCVSQGDGAPWSLCSGNGDNCPPGYSCGNGVCRKYCTKESDCGSKGNLCVSFADRNGVALDIGVCFIGCDYTKEGVCPTGLVCARQSAAVSFCVAPFTICPKEYTSNGVCDDPRPGGTRICAMGTDPECS